MNKLLLISGMALSLAGSLSLQADDAARIADLEKRLQELDQKYRALESRLDKDKEAAAEKAKTAPTVSLGAGGFQFRSADTNFVVKIRGLIQADSRWFFDDGGIGNNDTFVMRRARPIIEGTIFRDFDFLFVPEFGGGSTAANGTTVSPTPAILDAYLNYKYAPWLQVRVGKFKAPVGLEQLQADASSFFIERGLPAYLTPNRDMGVQVHGEGVGGFIDYAAGVFNGVADNASSANLDFDDEKDVAGRVVFHPFSKTSLEYLKGFGAGVGASIGNQEGAGGLGRYTTETVQPFFSYRSGAGTENVVADGEHYRLSPQGYYYYGPFGLLGESVISNQEVRNLGSGARARLEHTGWQVAVGYVLTGENASYKGVTPAKPFDPRKGQWGAWEAVLRYSTLDVDDKAFPVFANPGTAATRAAAWSAGINWYLNRNVRTSVNYLHTDFKGGALNPITREDEDGLLTRVQLSF